LQPQKGPSPEVMERKLTQMAPISFRSMTSGDGPFWGCKLLVNHPDYEMPIANSLSLPNFFRSSGISSASYSRFLERLNAANPSNTGSISQTPARYISGPASIARSALVGRGWSVGDSGVVAGLVTTVNTSNPGSPSDQYVLPLNPDLTYDFAVNWGDSQGEYVTNQTPGFPNITHTYAVAGSKTVTLTDRSTVEPGQKNTPVSGTSTFTVTVTPTVPGAWSFDIGTPTNIPGADPYIWSVTGTAA